MNSDGWIDFQNSEMSRCWRIVYECLTMSWSGCNGRWSGNTDNFELVMLTWMLTCVQKRQTWCPPIYLTTSVVWINSFLFSTYFKQLLDPLSCVWNEQNLIACSLMPNFVSLMIMGLLFLQMMTATMGNHNKQRILANHWWFELCFDCSKRTNSIQRNFRIESDI